MTYCSGNGFLYMLISQILFFIVTIGLILWFVKSNRQTSTFRQTLNLRLASGKITKREYESLLQAITKGEKK